MAFTLHEIHAVEAEGYYFDEGLGAGNFGAGDVVDEHVFDGPFATFDVCCFEVRLIVVVFCFFCFRYAPIALMVAILSRRCVSDLR